MGPAGPSGDPFIPGDAGGGPVDPDIVSFIRATTIYDPANPAVKLIGRWCYDRLCYKDGREKWIAGGGHPAAYNMYPCVKGKIPCNRFTKASPHGLTGLSASTPSIGAALAIGIGTLLLTKKVSLAAAAAFGAHMAAKRI